MPDVLYIHPEGVFPSFSISHYKGLSNAGQHSFGIIPMGIIGILNNLIKHGISAKGISIPLKKRLNPGFSLEEYLAWSKPSMVLIDVHWYVHISKGIEAAEICKKAGCTVVVGGLSSSLFWKQLIGLNCIDFVIRGDAELPMLLLAKSILKNLKCDAIPNLSGKDFSNPIGYRCTDIDNYDYVNIDFLEDNDVYCNMFDFWLMVGKGCPFNCEHCDGAIMRTEGYFGRTRTLFRSPQNIINDIKNIKSGTVAFSLDFGLMPKQLISAISEERFGICARNEFFELPDIRSVSAIKHSFKSFDLVFSPISGDDGERQGLGKKYKNKEFLSFLETLKKEDIVGGVIVYFTNMIISPFNVKEISNEQRKKLEKGILGIFPNAIVETMPQIIDPGTLGKDLDEVFAEYSAAGYAK
ncbi:hypothetical protein J4401_01985 [Candidatus Woesearchaeota archaeon]|nr:hypothetical protein [Candidatus Woesearchaeota archaeon]